MNFNFTAFGFNTSVNLLDTLIEAFETISWRKEPWLVGLLVLHIVLPLFYIRYRKHSTFLTVTLLLSRKSIPGHLS
ncbi:hypothetical protein FBUS_10357 [Fasciolopsis buskii]|uniref:Uncharacterized protein n=1 Tax=Fasciolopsis buskii TaxID=27845 RepID=A0A8E0VGF9_9TREM|nr:hypothetical protein FBUS_10357 [Fasciolopsis buski]